MTPTEQYLAASARLVEIVRAQEPAIRQAASWFADTIQAGRMVHVFASGHSRIMVEEMWPRYGSFPGFNPIVELSMTFHNLVVGANGQRQAMFIENVSGLADRILRNFALSNADSALVISSSGCSVVPVEMADAFQRAGIRVVAIVSARHSEKSTPRHRDDLQAEHRIATELEEVVVDPDRLDSQQVLPDLDEGGLRVVSRPHQLARERRA